MQIADNHRREDCDDSAADEAAPFELLLCEEGEGGDNDDDHPGQHDIIR